MNQIRPELIDRAVPITDCRPFRDNPRQGDVAVIADMLAMSGQYRPLVRWQETGEILVGNNTLAAAELLGWDMVAVEDIFCDETAARKVLIGDNRSSDLAGYDDAKLVDLLVRARDSGSLLATGFTALDVDAVLAAASGEPPPVADEDADGVFKEVALIYPSESERAEFLRHIETLAARWDAPPIATNLVLRALELSHA